MKFSIIVFLMGLILVSCSIVQSPKISESAMEGIKQDNKLCKEKWGKCSLQPSIWNGITVYTVQPE